MTGSPRCKTCNAVPLKSPRTCEMILRREENALGATMRSITFVAACAVVMVSAGHSLAQGPDAAPPRAQPATTPPSTGTPPASAAPVTLYTFNIGNWQGAAYSINGTFNHCAASASYKSGIWLAFAVSRTYSWSIGLTNPSWVLTKGQSYPISYSIDGNSPNLGTAVAITNNEVEVPLADSSALFKTFMQGELLRVAAASQNFSFDLTDTVQMLPALLRCVQSNVNTPPPSGSNPFASPG